MTIDVFDIALHNSSFPATYIGTGTVIANPKMSDPASSLSLYWTGSGNVVQIPLGDEPLRVEIVDSTNDIVWVWQRGLPATKTVKTVAAGTTTIDSTSAIVATAQDGTKGNFLLSLTAGLNASAAALSATILL